MCQVESHATAFLSTCSTVTIVVWLATEQQFCKASRRASRPNRQTGFAVFRTHSAPVPLVVQAGHSAGSTQQGMRQAVHLGLCPLRALSVLPGTCSSHQRGATRLHALRPVLFPSNLHSGPNIWRPSKVHHTSCCECLLRSLAHGCCCDSAASSVIPLHGPYHTDNAPSAAVLSPKDTFPATEHARAQKDHAASPANRVTLNRALPAPAPGASRGRSGVLGRRAGARRDRLLARVGLAPLPQHRVRQRLRRRRRALRRLRAPLADHAAQARCWKGAQAHGVS